MLIPSWSFWLGLCSINSNWFTEEESDVEDNGTALGFTDDNQSWLTPASKRDLMDDDDDDDDGEEEEEDDDDDSDIVSTVVPRLNDLEGVAEYFIVLPKFIITVRNLN